MFYLHISAWDPNIFCRGNSWDSYMAEVTWRSTFIGALMLFLIGLVVATCLNYASASLTSIKAGISGPFKCHFTKNSGSWKRYQILCNETYFVQLQDCIYIYVSYRPDDGSDAVSNIQLTPSYRYSNPAKKLRRNRIDGSEVESLEQVNR